MVEIKWKPSELPAYTTIQSDQLICRIYTKSPTGGWVETFPSYDPHWQDDADVDRKVVEYTILAIPPAWYDEWKIFSRNMPQYKINRRGDVRHTSHIEAAKRPSSVTEEMVRRAFSNNPL